MLPETSERAYGNVWNSTKSVSKSSVKVNEAPENANVEERTILLRGLQGYDRFYDAVAYPNNGKEQRTKSDDACSGFPSKSNGNHSPLDIQKRYAYIRQRLWMLTLASILANIVLFAFKIFLYIESRSLAVLASCVDSLLDLVSQFIIYYALRGTRNFDDQVYPVGRNRLEPIGIIVCATIMGFASIQVIWESLSTLIKGLFGGEDISSLTPSTTDMLVVLLVVAIAAKALLYLLCRRFRDESDSVMVLAEDHQNDVLSNSVALVTAYLSNAFVKLWWLDAVGGVVISLYIFSSWFSVAKTQAALLEGATAKPDFLKQVVQLSDNFHHKMFADIVRAYHFGKRYLVEVEVVLPGDMTVVDAHDISLGLQKEIEKLEDVERAFVHVDYKRRDEDEHKAAFEPTPPSSPILTHEACTTDDVPSLNLEDSEVIGLIYNDVASSRIQRTHTHISRETPLSKRQHEEL